MTVPFALGKVIDFIYDIDRTSPKMGDSPDPPPNDGVTADLHPPSVRFL